MHTHHHEQDAIGGSGNLRVAFWLNLSFAVIELLGGWWTGSLAILSDALHDLGDSISLALAWRLARFGERDSDHRYSYGYRRFTMLGALANIAILAGGSILVLSEAIPRLWHPQQPDARGMLLLALLGIAANGLAALRLKHERSLNARTAALHLLEDVLGWAAVLLVSIVLLFADLAVLDPILSIVVGGFVLVNAGRYLHRAGRLLLQGVPHDVDLAALQARLVSIQGVVAVHHAHFWSLDGEHHVFSVHLVVLAGTTPANAIAIKCAAREMLHGLGIEHSTIEIEWEGETCGARPGAIRSS
ncbi:MAG: cation diffusion facilitator family transporter [Anaerolineae bacterium]